MMVYKSGNIIAILTHNVVHQFIGWGKVCGRRHPGRFEGDVAAGLHIPKSPFLKRSVVKLAVVSITLPVGFSAQPWSLRFLF